MRYGAVKYTHLMCSPTGITVMKMKLTMDPLSSIIDSAEMGVSLTSRQIKIMIPT